MKIVYIDMDGVLVNLSKEILKVKTESPELFQKYKNCPDNIPNIFKEPIPIEGAIEAIAKLANCGLYDLFIATTASWENPESAFHKRIWIEKYFGDIFYKKMVITHRKDLLKGDYLIDDRLKNGAKEFNGIHLHFGWDYEKNKWNQYRTWDDILKVLIP